MALARRPCPLTVSLDNGTSWQNLVIDHNSPVQTCTISATQPGIYTILRRATDPAGNLETTSQEQRPGNPIMITVNTAAPIADISFPSLDTVVGNSGLKIIGVADDPVDFLRYDLAYRPVNDPTNWLAVDTNVGSTVGTTPVPDYCTLGYWDTNNLAEGYYVVRLEVKDTAGKVSMASHSPGCDLG